MLKKGILLINLGSPEGPDPQSVKQYLKIFLNDKRVIDLPDWWRRILVNLFIIPFRYKATAAAYQQIWLASGSPLLQNSLKMKEALSEFLGSDYQVELAMRYGQPSIESAINELRHCDQLSILPLFPQYSSAATGSAIEASLQAISTLWNIPALTVINDFYHHPDFISAYADVIHEKTAESQIDYFLFSYHGLPERHIKKSGCQENCDRNNACPVMEDKNHYCYRAQCYETSNLLGQALNLSPAHYGVSFQSRLGLSPWIKPYTDKLLASLIKQGVLHLAVACPSFVADCLETLEEVALRTREQWHKLGGKEFTFIPCLNDRPLWIQAMAKILQRVPIINKDKGV